MPVPTWGAPERIDTGNAVLALRRFGRPEAPALLLVHGFPLHGFTWRHLVPELARHFHVLVPDLAGKGDSDWSEATDFTWDGHAANLRILMDRVGVRSYALAGQDTGATIARRLALHDPRVSHLAVLNSEIPGHRPPWIREYQLLMRLPGAALSFRQLLRSRTFRRSPMGFGGCFHDLGLIDGEFHEAFVQPLIRSARRMDGVGRYLVGLTWPVIDDLAVRHAELKMPVLLLWGEDDPTFPVARAEPMARQFPAARFVTVPRAKLLLHEERPAEVLGQLLPFLRAA